MIHESCHDLLLAGRTWMGVMGIICDLPLAFPGAIVFRT